MRVSQAVDFHLQYHLTGKQFTIDVGGGSNQLQDPGTVQEQ